MKKGKSIKEIAEEIGVSKQAIQKRIAREPLCTSILTYIHTKGGTKYIEDIGEQLIKQAFSKKYEIQGIEDKSTTNIDRISTMSMLVDTLHKQLDVKDIQLTTKDIQLAEKDRQIEELTKAIRIQAESINADRHNELANTISNNEVKLIDSSEKPLSRWQRVKKAW